MLRAIELYNEDCLSGLLKIPNESVDLIITDPPYEISCIGGDSLNRARKFDVLSQQLEKATLTSGYDIDSFSREVSRLQGKNINAYFWCNKKQIPDYFRVYVGVLNCKFEILCWHKRNALPAYSNKYLSDTEYCLYFHKGKGRTHPQNYNDAKTYFMGPINQNDKKKYKHPTIKPLEYIEVLIRNSSNEGDLILDPFAGSGTTAVACKRLNRRCIAYELNETYYNIANERINNAERLNNTTMDYKKR